MRNWMLTIAVCALVFVAGTALGAITERRAAQDAEYIRVVATIADHYEIDPSELEMDCGLVDEDGDIKR